MNQIKIGVIGASGNIGRYTHCENIVKYTDGAVLTAVSSSSKASVQKIADHYCVQAMENAEELITSDQVDAVLICSSNETHVPYTIRCLEEGKPVFLEKPMANTLEEAQLLLEAEKKAGEHMVQIGFMRRFDRSFQRGKMMLDQGMIGEVTMIRSNTYGPSEPKEWMYDVHKNYGPLGEVNSHDFDSRAQMTHVMQA